MDKKNKEKLYDDQLIPKDVKTIIRKTEGVGTTEDVLSIVYYAIESTVGGVIITDREGRITYANQSFVELFDYDNKSDVIGLHASGFFISKEVNKITDVLTLVDLAEGSTEEFLVEKKNGSKIYVEVSASSVKNEIGMVVGVMASFVDITRRKNAEEERETLLGKLQGALNKIEKLQGLIPICSSCKKIRDDKGYWHQIEAYIHEHSGADFSHGMCDECSDKAYGDQEWYKKVIEKREGKIKIE